MTRVTIKKIRVTIKKIRYFEGRRGGKSMKKVYNWQVKIDGRVVKTHKTEVSAKKHMKRIRSDIERIQKSIKRDARRLKKTIRG